MAGDARWRQRQQKIDKDPAVMLRNVNKRSIPNKLWRWKHKTRKIMEFTQTTVLGGLLLLITR